MVFSISVVFRTYVSASNDPVLPTTRCLPENVDKIRHQKQLHAHVTPITKLDLPLLDIGDLIIQRSPDGPQPALVLWYHNIRMSVKADDADSGYNGGGSNAECLEQTVF